MNKDFELIQYQEARAQERHLSTISYAILGFFISIAGGYFTIRKDAPSELPFLIGCLFLFVILILAKVSHTASDNSTLYKNIEGTAEPTHKFELTSIEGIGNSIQYFVLLMITLLFLFEPLTRKPFLHKYDCAYWWAFCVTLIVLFVLIYYVLANGKFIDRLIEYKETYIKTQIVVYLIILFYFVLYVLVLVLNKIFVF